MKGIKTDMPRRKSKVLTDKNQNEFMKHDINAEASPSSNVFQEIDMMTISENNYSDLDLEIPSIPACKLIRKIPEIENKSPLENASFRNRDDLVLFKRRQPTVLQPLGENQFLRLSDEVLLHIFQMLPKSSIIKCAAVCKRWRTVCYDETIWKRYDFGRRIIKPCTLEILLKRGNALLRLAFSTLRHPVFSDQYINYPWKSNLQYLDLSMVIIETEDLALILSKCHLLKKLSVENCILNEECCLNIAENSDLEMLNLTMCQGITPNGLRSICLCCVNLKELNLGWCPLSESCAEIAFPLFPPGIRRLNLSGHREALTDAVLIKVVNRCRGLRELDISDNGKITNVSVEVLIKQCSKLQHLHTSRSYNIPTETNKRLSGLKHFKNLEIFQTLTDAALVSLRAYMPEIKINQTILSTIARPTVGNRRTSIWENRTRDG